MKPIPFSSAAPLHWRPWPVALALAALSAVVLWQSQGDSEAVPWAAGVGTLLLYCRGHMLGRH